MPPRGFFFVLVAAWMWSRGHCRARARTPPNDAGRRSWASTVAVEEGAERHGRVGVNEVDAVVNVPSPAWHCVQVTRRGRLSGEDKRRRGE